MSKETVYSEADKAAMHRLFNLMEDVNGNVIDLKVNISKNNVILKQHHVRSTNLETIVDKVRDALAELANKVAAINTNVKYLDKDISSIDKDIEPIKKHVKKIERWTNNLMGLPIILKLVFWCFIFVTSGIGCYNLVVKMLN